MRGYGGRVIVGVEGLAQWGKVVWDGRKIFLVHEAKGDCAGVAFLLGGGTATTTSGRRKRDTKIRVLPCWMMILDVGPGTVDQSPCGGIDHDHFEWLKLDVYD